MRNINYDWYLLVGNVVISKPNVAVPLFSKLIQKIINSSDLPKGVNQVVFGGKELGQFLTSLDFDMICFTGAQIQGSF